MSNIGKKELVAQVQSTLTASNTTVSKSVVEDVINATLSAVVEATKQGQEVRLVGFGTFSKKTLAAKKGVNPLTGKELNLPERHKIGFKMSASLKEGF